MSHLPTLHQLSLAPTVPATAQGKTYPLDGFGSENISAYICPYWHLYYEKLFIDEAVNRAPL